MYYTSYLYNPILFPRVLWYRLFTCYLKKKNSPPVFKFNYYGTIGPRYTHVHFLFRKKVRWIRHYFLFTSKSSTGYIIKIIFLYRCQLNGDTMILSYKSLHCSVFIFMLLRKTSESCTVRLNNGWQHIKSSL